MNQQEVNEYMQRYLDGDLSEEETAQLEQYLRNAPASAAMFERLKRLNSELEQLPKVTPPVSIVDMILPQLESERMVKEGGASDSAAVSGDAAGPALPGERPNPARRGRYAWIAAGSAVAASIAFTIWIAGSPEMGVNTAEHAASGYSGSATSSAAGASPSVPLSGAAESANMASPGAIMRSTRDDASSGQSPAAEKQKAEDAGITPTPVAGEPLDGDSEQIHFFLHVDQNAPVSGSGESTEEARPLSEPPGEEAGESVEGAPGSSGEAGIFGWIESAATGSPDASKVAEIQSEPEGGQFIRITDRLGRELYVSETYDGVIRDVVWSEDSARLEFDVTDAAGGTENFRVVIDLKADTETVQEEPPKEAPKE